jgi:copper oxidase (laccase) domain-containing protein
VSQQFPGHGRETEWGTASIDLAAAIRDQLAGMEVWVSPDCTMDDARYHSHRRDGTPSRQVAVTWLPA